MNRRSPIAGAAASAAPTLALLCLLFTTHANANTYFKCVDARGAVTVQQTACVTTSSQEEKKVWGQGTQATPPTATAVNDRSTPTLRRGDEMAKSKDR